MRLSKIKVNVSEGPLDVEILGETVRLEEMIWAGHHSIKTWPDFINHHRNRGGSKPGHVIIPAKIEQNARYNYFHFYMIDTCPRF